MRRAIATSLLMMFSWLLIAPFFVSDAEANLPPCCRRHGKHHCMMQMMMQWSENQKGFHAASEKCPCVPASTGAVHTRIYVPEPRPAFYAEVVRPAVRAAQTEARFRIAFPRSHQRRGPPNCHQFA